MIDRLAIARRDYIAVRATADAECEAAYAEARAELDAAGTEKGEHGLRIPAKALVKYNITLSAANARWSAAIAAPEAEILAVIEEAKTAGTFHFDTAPDGVKLTDRPLPGWETMTDLDKGAALLHLDRREWDGPEAAVRDHPARYFNHPALTSLSPADASAYAASLSGPNGVPGLEPDDYVRLYGLAYEADQFRQEQAA